MKVLIIGSKGFIGTHLSDFFLKTRLEEVWGCDVVNDYNASNYFLVDASNAEFESIFQRNSFDLCINCSGAASVPDSMVNPLRDYYLNTKHVFNILESIRKYKPSTKFLNLSSAAVYGSPKRLPISENDLLAPLSPYGWHKYQSELICREFSAIYKIPTCSARVFSAFGPGLKKQIFWDWAQKIIKTQKIEILGSGNESRDFIFIDDIVNAVNCIIDNASFNGESINVANGDEVFIKDAIQAFRKLFNSDFQYSFTNTTRTGDPINWVADIGLLKSLGYKQGTSFEEGILKYIEWFTEEQ